MGVQGEIGVVECDGGDGSGRGRRGERGKLDESFTILDRGVESGT